MTIGSRTLVVVGGVALVGLLATCLFLQGQSECQMDVRIENEAGEPYGQWFRIACDVVNRGDPGSVTIWGGVYRDGDEVGSAEQEISLATNERRPMQLYVRIDPEVAGYSFRIEARDEEPA